MNSMTGFGFADGHYGSFHFSVELKSYNNRYLDLILNFPSAFSQWEPELRQRLTQSISRGRVELTIRLKDHLEKVEIVPHWNAITEYKKALLAVKKWGKLKGSLKLEHFLNFPDLLSVQKERNIKESWTFFDPILQKAIDDFQMMRQREGQNLKVHIMDQLRIIQSECAEIASQSDKIEQSFRQTIQKKFEELSAGKDENRILSEVASLMMRHSINEELVRLASHIELFQNLTQNSLVGKKLDFLCQEIGREINTIGSKAPFAEIQQKVVEMKDALENIREQLRNVE